MGVESAKALVAALRKRLEADEGKIKALYSSNAHMKAEIERLSKIFGL